MIEKLEKKWWNKFFKTKKLVIRNMEINANGENQIWFWHTVQSILLKMFLKQGTRVVRFLKPMSDLSIIRKFEMIT